MTGVGDERRPWIPILSYHSISESSAAGFRRYTLSADRFREHLEYLRDRGYGSLTISEAAARLDGKTPRPGQSVALTFDDAFEDFATVALPLLLEFQTKATLFVPTAFVGGTSTWLDREGESQRRIASWSQLREIVAAGIECGAHSHSHPELDRLPAAELEEEIRVPKALLEQHLGREAASFAYPFGYHSRAVRRAVEAAGYRAACAVGETSASPRCDPLAIPRLTVPFGTDASGLARLLDDHAGRWARATSEIKRKVWRAWRSSSGPARRVPAAAGGQGK